jgi:Asp-tRNA(Asn)/Glu-tRNA(Gln) amidotransferase A subunit family amidase
LVGFQAEQRFNDHGPPTAGPILERRRDDGRVGVPPANAAADLVRRKLISARELAELVLAKIDALNPALNAVVEVTVEAVLGQGAAADEAVARGRDLGPWHGVPMTVKDSFYVEGMQTTWGNPAFKDHVADRDATVVQRLRDAGAVIVGKTNVHFMLADFGQTANDSRPFDERTISTAEGDRPYLNQSFWIAPASLAGLPALSAPIGVTPAGLPVGAQIIGPLYEDDTAVTFAELLADVTGGYEPPPLHPPLPAP